MKDRLCNQVLLQLYNYLTRKWNEYYIEHPEVFKLVKPARKLIVSGLILYCCVRPSWLSSLFIDPYRAILRYRRGTETGR